MRGARVDRAKGEKSSACFFRRERRARVPTVRGMKFRMKRRGSPTTDRKDERDTEGGAISGRKKKGQLTTVGRIVLGMFFSIFLLAGVAATYALGVKPWTDVWRARSWVEVPCLILSSEVKSHSGSDSTTYRVAISYTYDVDGHILIVAEGLAERVGATIGRSFGTPIARMKGEQLEGVRFQHPLYERESVGVLGDYVSTGLGVLGLAWQSSPALTELEEVVMDWLR